MNKRALTLVEIIVSTVILALTMAGIASLFIGGKKYVLHSRSRMAGGELGRLFLDPLQNDVSQQDWEDPNNCVNKGVGCPGQTSVGDIQYTPYYTPPTYVKDSNNNDTTLRRVTVRIDWNEETRK